MASLPLIKTDSEPIAHARKGLPAATPSADTDAPFVENVTPPTDADDLVAISSLETLSFDLVDNPSGDILVALAWVDFVTLKTSEVIHDGKKFIVPYAKFSTRTAIVNGFHYDVRRDGGWRTGTIKLNVIAFDSAGNEGAEIVP